MRPNMDKTLPTTASRGAVAVSITLLVQFGGRISAGFRPIWLRKVSGKPQAFSRAVVEGVCLCNLFS